MRGIPYIRFLFNIIVWLKSFHYKFAHFSSSLACPTLIFTAVLCRQYFCKTFLTLNCNKCSNNVNHRVGCLIASKVVTLSALSFCWLFCRNIQNLARCCSRRSQRELLLHRISKGNEPLLLTERGLTRSLCSRICPCPQHRSDSSPKSDHQCSHWSVLNYGLQNIVVFSSRIT